MLNVSLFLYFEDMSLLEDGHPVHLEGTSKVSHIENWCQQSVEWAFPYVHTLETVSNIYKAHVKLSIQ